jgi:hypothetical protein
VPQACAPASTATAAAPARCKFNLRDGPRSTWERYGTDGNHDGATDVDDPADAIPAAATCTSWWFGATAS